METDKKFLTAANQPLAGKLIFLAVGILIAISIMVTFWRYIIRRDYIIQEHIDCDPETENCFVWQCDPMSLEEGEKCTGNPDEDVWYYKIIRRSAKSIPDCDPDDESCAAYVCGEEETGCSEELCTAENVPEGEECNNPEQYLLENPAEEECPEDDQKCLDAQESEECDPGDEECLSGQSEECVPEGEECADEPTDEDTGGQDVPAGNSDEEQDSFPTGIEPM